MPLIGTLTQIGPTWTLTQASDGLTFLLGGTPDQFQAGGLSLDVVPDDSFVGSVTILGMGGSKDESDANVTPMPYPFRAHYLNGAPSDLSMQVGSTTITSLSSLLIPASGKQVAIQVACSQGSAVLYAQAVAGPTAP